MRIALSLRGSGRTCRGLRSPEEAARPTSRSKCSSTTLNRGYSSGLDQTNANVQAIVRDIWNRYPAIKTMYGWRQDVTPDHPAGRAVDVMIPSYSSNQALGWEIANYYKANASKYNINYIIFAQKIWSVQRSSEGWRLMADRGSDNANHYNHVHINTYRVSWVGANGVAFPPRVAPFRTSHRPSTRSSFRPPFARSRRESLDSA